ncbi:MAG: hypothetical protein AB7E49_04140 [Campylobacterales bacterium]
MLKKWLLAALIPATLIAQENLVSLNLNNTDLEVEYEKNQPAGASSRLYYGVGALNAEDEFEKTNVMLSGYVSIMGLTPVPGLAASIGFKGVTAAVDVGGEDLTVMALPVRIGVLYTLPLVVRSHVAGFVAYAPKSLALSDCESYTETRLEAIVEPMEGGMIVLGWRNMQFKPDGGGTYEFNRSGYLGVKMLF